MGLERWDRTLGVKRTGEDIRICGVRKTSIGTRGLKDGRRGRGVAKTGKNTRDWKDGRVPAGLLGRE